jgi:two-component system CheB/CheR fusion protein
MSELSTAEQPIKVGTKIPEWTSDDFLAMVSHELRNPIAAILGWADVVSAESTDAKILEHAIEAIKRSALHGAKLINQLMDFSRIRNGCLKLDAQNISLVSTLETAIEMIKPQARAKAIKLEAELPEYPILIAGDAARLQQIFTNLLSNAIKFTPAGGRVRVHVELGNQAKITVSDTGRGIGKEFLPFVFDRYRQQVAETTETGGLGLGLAISRYLVEEHGGTIYASSPGSGKGATFTVCLPPGQLGLQSARPSEEKDSVWV